MRRDSGFTLIELMITVTIAAILLGVGVPSMAEFVRVNQRAAAVNSLVTDLQRARSAAASVGRNVVICHSANGSSCSGQASPDWAEGWIVFIDDNQDGLEDATDDNGQLDAGEQLLSVGMPRNGVTMTGTNFNRARFSPGFRTLGGGGFGGTVVVCPSSPTAGRAIVVSATGRPRLRDATVAECP